MTERVFETSCGPIHYWISDTIKKAIPTLVFLPGLTADHRLFEKQLEYFEPRYNVMVWDAPGHAASWPFSFEFDLFDKARWLKDILDREQIDCPILIGQSMGGYVSQAFAGLYPNDIKGFIAIDSAPLLRSYLTTAELWLLKRMEAVYRYYPWKALLRSGVNGVAASRYGRQLMHSIMMVYDGDKERYAKLSGHGMYILATAIEKDLQYQLNCPSLLICGRKDHAGSCIRYNKAWHKKSGIPLIWLDRAGHNSNTDEPVKVNWLIERLAEQVIARRENGEKAI